MFILTEKGTGGVYALPNIHDVKTVHMFEQEDDAVRYLELLKANDYKKRLELLEIDVEAVAINCDKFGYAYSIVAKDDLIVPPPPKPKAK
jgi:hypothetical protein|tara:strand:- start:231 stop:500 length:270 start_codon:yes stop_codon:yes gene_type:complete